MKICAITMVYKDYWALSQWYAHYSKFIGSENLFVIAHGVDRRISKLCPKASVITIPRDDLSNFDSTRNQMLNSFQDGFGKVYDWVIRTDADELICLDPKRYASFEALLGSREADALFALGLNVVQQEGDVDLAKNSNVFDHRRQAIFSGHYSKAWVVRNGVKLDLHGVKLKPSKLDAFDYVMPPGVYLAHLKFANLTALANGNVNRRKIANRKEKGLPGTAWRKADRIASEMFEKAASFDHVDWSVAEKQAYETQIAEHKRSKSGLIRSKFNEFKYKTTLPDWFGKAD